jgi:hypothetical protein
MKKVKKEAASFPKLSAIQMKKIEGGGYYVRITDENGNVRTVWVD